MLRKKGTLAVLLHEAACRLVALAPTEDKPPMPKNGTNLKGEFAFFNVVYEDDSVRSNRRVPNQIHCGLKDRRERWPARSLDQTYRAGRREEQVAAPPDRRRHRVQVHGGRVAPRPRLRAPCWIFGVPKRS